MANELRAHALWLGDWLVRGATLSTLLGHPIDMATLADARKACHEALRLLNDRKVPTAAMVQRCRLSLDERRQAWRIGWIGARFGKKREKRGE